MRVDESKLREWTPDVRIDFNNTELRALSKFSGVRIGCLPDPNNLNIEEALKRKMEPLPFKQRFWLK